MSPFINPAATPCSRHVPVQVQADEADPHVQRPEARDLLPLQHWAGGEGAGLRLLGARLAGLALFYARGDAAPGALARQPPQQAVRGSTQQGMGSASV